MKVGDIEAKLIDGRTLDDGAILLDLEGFKLSVRSNSAELINNLGIYFAHTLGAGSPDAELLAYEGAPPDLGIDFVDWKREPGKTGRKDSYFDLEDGRLIRKVRTGMVFLQSADKLICAGPCVENDNQVINYINAQYMNFLQQNGALICHASALTFAEKGLAIAGLSGGGKSTLMLQMLENSNLAYVTNDRLFLQAADEGVRALGIPKLPRINPGTILNNERLRPMLDDARQGELSAMARAELWDLEEKYDVFINDLYGDNKIFPHTVLSGFLVLNWSRDSDEACTIEKVDLTAREDLLGAIMKSPGPFYQFADGRFYQDDMELVHEPYLEILRGIEIYEARGQIDFDYAAHYCQMHILERG